MMPVIVYELLKKDVCPLGPARCNAQRNLTLLWLRKNYGLIVKFAEQNKQGHQSGCLTRCQCTNSI